MTELIHDPTFFVGKEEEIVGFAYQGKEGEWYLSSEPNLRSCCVGSGAKRARQVRVEGNVSISSSPVRMKGKLVEKSEGLVLVNPEVLQQSKGELPTWPLLFIVFGIGVALLFGGTVRGRRKR